MGHIKTRFSERAPLMLPKPWQVWLKQHTHARSCSLLAPVYDCWPVVCERCGWCHRQTGTLSSSRTTEHPTWKVACRKVLAIFFPCSPTLSDTDMPHCLVNCWLLLFQSVCLLALRHSIFMAFDSSVILKIDGVDINHTLLLCRI